MYELLSTSYIIMATQFKVRKVSHSPNIGIVVSNIA